MEPVNPVGFAAAARAALRGVTPARAEVPFAETLAQAVEASQGSAFPVPANGQERNLLWTLIARERPELLESDVAGSQNDRSSMQARARDIRDRLMEAGVDRTTALVISNREASTAVRRPDDSVPGVGSSGYLSLPDSIRSSRPDPESPVREGIGYAYVDRYGFPHVVKDLATALNFSGNGKVYEYDGRFGGGFPRDKEGARAMLELPEARMYSNAYRIAQEADSNSARAGSAPAGLPGLAAGRVQKSPVDTAYVEGFLDNARPSALAGEAWREWTT